MTGEMGAVQPFHAVRSYTQMASADTQDICLSLRNALRVMGNSYGFLLFRFDTSTHSLHFVCCLCLSSGFIKKPGMITPQRKKVSKV